jgi:ribosomal protein S18 acetylase RimI-like enzyme
MSDAAEQPPSPAKIRSFRSADQAACGRLYREGLIGGRIAENDTALDLDDIENVYMKGGGNHFWVAELPGGELVGMIGVQHHDEGTGVIRRLRVAKDHRRKGIGAALLETAIRFCEQQGYLKITLDTFMESEPAIKLFEKFRFRLMNKRKIGDRELMYFILDLYGREKKAK